MAHYDFKKIMRESLPILSLCILLEIIGGNLLDAGSSDLFAVPVVLALVPIVNGLGGNLGTIFGSRLSSGLHLGYIELSWKDKRLWENIRLSFSVGLFIFAVMGVLVWALAPAMGLGRGVDGPMDMTFWKFFAVVMLAGGCITVIAILVSVVTAFVSFRRGIDPDNVVTPLVTTIGDLSGITLVIIFVTLIIVN